MLAFLILLIFSFLPFWRLTTGGIAKYVDITFYHWAEQSWKTNQYLWLPENNGYGNIIVAASNALFSAWQVGLERLGMSAWSINRLFLVGSVFLMLSAGYYFACWGFGHLQPEISIRKRRALAFLASVFFVFSPLLSFSLSFGWDLKYPLPLAFSIFSFTSFVKFCEDGTRRRFFFLSVICSFLAACLLQQLILALALIFFYLAFQVLASDKRLLLTKQALVRYAAYVVGVVLVGALWFLPFGYLTLVQKFSYYQVNPLTSMESISHVPQIVLRALNFRSLWPARPVDAAMNAPWTFVGTSFLTGLAIAGIIKYRQKKAGLFFAFGTLLLFALANGPSPPLGILYKMLVKIPLMTAFRDPFKFNGWLTLFVSFLAAGAIGYLDGKLRQKLNPWLRVFGLGVLIVVIISSSHPLLTGNLGGAIAPYQLPAGYLEARDYFASLSPDHRILILPMPELFSNFTWHQDMNHIPNPLRELVSIPYIYDEFWLVNLNRPQRALVDLFYRRLEEPQAKEEATRLFRLLGVDYVLLQGDQTKGAMGLPFFTPKNLLPAWEKFLGGVGSLEKAWGDLRLYKINASVAQVEGATGVYRLQIPGDFPAGEVPLGYPAGTVASVSESAPFTGEECALGSIDLKRVSESSENALLAADFTRWTMKDGATLISDTQSLSPQGFFYETAVGEGRNVLYLPDSQSQSFFPLALRPGVTYHFSFRYYNMEGTPLLFPWLVVSQGNFSSGGNDVLKVALRDGGGWHAADFDFQLPLHFSESTLTFRLAPDSYRDTMQPIVLEGSAAGGSYVDNLVITPSPPSDYSVLPNQSSSSPPCHQPDILSEKISPVEYFIKVKKANGPFVLTLKENFDAGWIVKPVGNEAADYAVGDHFEADGFANAWIIKPSGSGADFSLKLEYYPQVLYRFGFLASAFFLGVNAIAFVWFWVREKNHA